MKVFLPIGRAHRSPAARLTAPILRRRCACGAHTPGGETCRSCAAEEAGLQRSLTIGASNDPLELEADRVADEVMRGNSTNARNRTSPVLRGAVQPRSHPARNVPASVHDALRAAGRPLDTNVRADMESRFGHDFSRVRVHNSGAAAQSARDVDAKAYTVGHDIVFGAGQFAPMMLAGGHLLAHELTHSIQQGATSSVPGDVVRRAPAEEADGSAVQQHGGTLPYRQAKELIDCMRIMGQASSEYCRQQVLGEKPQPKLSPQAEALARELATIIAGAEWKEIRKRVYPLESAPGIKRSRDRRAALLPDMTGLGRIKSLDQFATKIRSLQTRWGALAGVNERMKEVDKITGEQLTAADVPKFIVFDKEPMEFKGFFSPSGWKFVISEELVSGSTLDDADAGELANTTLHESRHAEQHFLAARFSAGVNNSDAAAIRTEHGIPQIIAEEAVRLKFSATTDSETKKLGRTMHKAMVTDRLANQRISNDDGLRELANERAKAATALQDLQASESPATLASATAQRDALKAQIGDVERRYTLYRQIPYEADAHEVGDAAQEAFRLSK